MPAYGFVFKEAFLLTIDIKESFFCIGIDDSYAYEKNYLVWMLAGLRRLILTGYVNGKLSRSDTLASFAYFLTLSLQ